MTDLEHAWHPASGNPRIAHALLQGMAELNGLFPHRPQGAQEGTIGDTNHLAEGWTASDHNPWVIDATGSGVVRAWDIQVLNAPFNASHLADHLADLMRQHAKFFGTRGYVIYNGQITAWQPWGSWQPYTGPDRHTEHIHLSLGRQQDEYDSTIGWRLAEALAPAPPAPVPAPASGPSTPVQDWLSALDELSFRKFVSGTVHTVGSDIDSHVIAYSGPRLVRFPRSKAPTAIYAWDGSSLLWLPAGDYQALGNLHVADVPDHVNSNIYRCPIVAGTRDPRK